jgi:hypothetical protein
MNCQILSQMRNFLFELIWGKSQVTYPKGASKTTNAILEKDYDEIIDKVCNYHRTDRELKQIYDAACTMTFDKFVDWSSKNGL